MSSTFESKPVKLDEELAELIAVLSSRWRALNGSVHFGVEEDRLKKALGVKSRASLERKLEEVQKRLLPMGLEIVRYSYEGKFYYCIRTIYGVPSELTDEEYAVLGVIIYHVETNKEYDYVTKKQLEITLVNGNYLNMYQFEQILRNLEMFGYIKRRRGNVYYGSRTLVEFDEERRKAIADEVKAWLV